MTASPETLAAFRDLITARKYGPFDADATTAFRAAGGIELCRAVAAVSDPMPDEIAMAFMGPQPRPNWCSNGNYAGDAIAPSCTYGQAAHHVANRLGFRL